MPPSPSVFASIGTSPIQDIRLVARYQRKRRGWQFVATSLPGHLIHLIIRGQVRQECNGRGYHLKPGDAIWYHEDELVRGEVVIPWTFYSVNFIAPSLPPPAFDSRVYHHRQRLIPGFRRLLAAWCHTDLSPLVRKLRAHAALLEILADLTVPSQSPFAFDPQAQLWWDLETQLRHDLRQPASLTTLSLQSHRSPATIARACTLATGLSPMRRLKSVRMSLARGLLLYSDLNVSQVADQVGYARIHEFSRDYRKHFGHPPSAARLPGNHKVPHQ